MSDLWQTQSLTVGDLSLVCLPSIGGRLWDVLYKGESLFFQNQDLIGKPVTLDALAMLPTRSPQFPFPLWGGEKTWVAPDRDWPNGAPHIMLDSAPYEVISADSELIHFESAICPDSGLRIDRKIRINNTNSWTIDHTITNCGNEKRFAGIWSVMMIPQPSIIALSQPEQAKAAAVFGSSENYVESQQRSVIIRCPEPHEFKVGMQNREGLVLMALGNNQDNNHNHDQDCEKSLWLRCRTTPMNASEQFAHQHNFEVFNSGDYPYCEAEWHSPAKDLAPGESIEFQQCFSVGTKAMLFPHDSTSLQEMELVTCIS